MLQGKDTPRGSGFGLLAPLGCLLLTQLLNAWLYKDLLRHQNALTETLADYGGADRIGGGLFCLVALLLVGFICRPGVRATFTALVRSWQTIFGDNRARLIIVAWVLPQRLVDLGSGYTPLPAGSALSWGFLMLDLIRGACALALLSVLVSAAPSAPPPAASPDDSGDSPPVSSAPALQGGLGAQYQPFRPFSAGMGVLILVGLALPWLIQFGPLEGIPHVQDEIIQTAYARLLAEGAIRFPELAWRESFVTWGVADNGRHLFTTFQPGYALILSLWSRLGVPEYANGVLFGLSLVLVWRLFAATHGPNVAATAVTLLACSPFLIVMAGGRMNHIWALVLFLGCARGLLLDDLENSRAGTLLAGLSLGVLFMTRRLDGVATALAIGGYLGWRQGVAWKTLRSFVVIGGTAAAVFAVQMLVNSAHSGDTWQLLRHAQSLAGALPERAWESYLQNLGDNLLGLQAYAFGGLLPGLAGLAVLGVSLAPSRRALESFLGLHALLSVALYGAYEYQDFCYGPRFFLCLLPATALGFSLWLERVPFAPGWSRAAVLPLVATTALFFVGQQVWGDLARSYWHIDRRFERALIAQVPEKSVVFLESATRARLPVARELARRGWSSEEIGAVIEVDALDYAGLTAALASASAAGKPETQGLVDRFVRQSCVLHATRFHLNEVEVIRLNGPRPFQQSRLVALDLGDEPNQRLMALLPGYRAWVVRKRWDEYRFEVLQPSGIGRFQ